ncbi:MAG: hypothetical protein A3K19_03120 [Lentisphaerae bacterium RIFOXYB12_FULL_65_16]|nr:MAG: hypothetical protein A3K18_23475 [Lentisphaerae bacterium RIFOXYA12_64_32]OGV92118.1 MAG: hypothetical protein A3K19_03120 [Lentisphaerae bacterium RIFOXYB12_FULL_65_16]
MPSTPAIKIESLRVLVNDGNHNAFTDLCRFKGRMYLAFRSCPEGHMIFPSSRIVVMTSDDGQAWRQVFTFAVPERDVRDPHFLVFKDTLFVYAGTWFCAPAVPGKYDMNEHLGYGAWSSDGAAWQGPRLLEGTYGHYIWRAAACGDKAFMCGRRKRDFCRTQDSGDGTNVTQGALLESDDGLVWKTAAIFRESGGDETAFLFEADGAVLAVARSPGLDPALLLRSRPPYRTWESHSLERYIGGPMLARWGERLLVGGRRMLDRKDPAKTVLYWLNDNRLEPAAEFPSGGDNSYPGFLPLSDTRGLLSYYSSHEGSGTSRAPAAIYLAELSLT